MSVPAEGTAPMETDGGKATRAQRAWKRVTLGMLEWVEFMSQKQVAVESLARSHPCRRKELEREEAERAATRCRHPPEMIRRGGNQSAKYETCLQCGIRVSYEPKDQAKKSNMEDKTRAASRCTQLATKPARIRRPKKEEKTQQDEDSDGQVWDILEGELAQTSEQATRRRKSEKPTTSEKRPAGQSAIESLTAALTAITEVQREQGKKLDQLTKRLEDS